MSDRCLPHGVRDCMLCRLKNPVKTQTPPAELDPQAQEAAARIADTTPVEVDFGTIAAEWNNRTDAYVEKLAEVAFAPDPPVKLATKGTHLAGNPIVDAAAAYTNAQADVDMAVAHVAELESDLSSARTRLEEVKADRDVKKQVLQALVGGAA